MKRALLINPPIHDFSAFDLWMKPLGLLTIGAALEAAGWRVDLLDCLDRFHPAVSGLAHKSQPRLMRYGCAALPREPIPPPAVLKEVPRVYHRYGLPPAAVRGELANRPMPDLIAVTSMMTYWYPGVFEVIQLAKEAFPGVPVILGGVYATLCRSHAQSGSGADHVIAGPGERQILQAASAGGEVDLTALRPAYHLLSRITSISVMTSRGCPFRCSYCASRLLWPGFAQRDPDSVIQEIESGAARFGVRDVAFYDDALLVNAHTHLLPILRALRRRMPDLRFHTPNGLHTRLVDDDVAMELRQSHFTTLRLSFESACAQRQGDSSHKVTNMELRQAIQRLLHVGYTHRELEVYVMIGMPGQEVREIEETLHFVHQAGGWIKLAQYSPIPGTPEFDRACEFNPAIRGEPLLHNPSIYPASGDPGRFETYQGVKRLASALNAQLPGPKKPVVSDGAR